MLTEQESGLEAWLIGHGIIVEKTVVLDDRHAAFPLPVLRRAGGYEFRDMQFVDYPYLLDVRDDGLNSEHPITSSLPRLTVGWASPIQVEKRSGLELTTLLSSSDSAWRANTLNVLPSIDGAGASSLNGDGIARARSIFAVLLQGRFKSGFDAAPRMETDSVNTDALATSPPPTPNTFISQSPESARLLVVASNDFASDQVLSGVIAAAGTQYLGPLEFLLNTVDWALENRSLMQIRSRAHFNRTLPPLERSEQQRIEYLNYAVVLLLLVVLYALWRLQLRRRSRTLMEELR